MKNDTIIELMILFLFLVFIPSEVFADSPTNNMTNNAVNGGIGLGSVLGIVISWSRNQSILWAILHGIFGWFYVIYFALTRQK